MCQYKFLIPTQKRYKKPETRTFYMKKKVSKKIQMDTNIIHRRKPQYFKYLHQNNNLS